MNGVSTNERKNAVEAKKKKFRSSKEVVSPSLEDCRLVPDHLRELGFGRP
jgi:hypothetical protein